MARVTFHSGVETIRAFNRFLWDTSNLLWRRAALPDPVRPPFPVAAPRFPTVRADAADAGAGRFRGQARRCVQAVRNARVGAAAAHPPPPSLAHTRARARTPRAVLDALREKRRTVNVCCDLTCGLPFVGYARRAAAAGELDGSSGKASGARRGRAARAGSADALGRAQVRSKAVLDYMHEHGSMAGLHTFLYTFIHVLAYKKL